MADEKRLTALEETGAKPQRPAWMDKRRRYLTREEKALADAWDAEQDAKRVARA